MYNGLLDVLRQSCRAAALAAAAPEAAAGLASHRPASNAQQALLPLPQHLMQLLQREEKSIDFSLVALQLLYSLIPIIGAVARQQHSCCQHEPQLMLAWTTKNINKYDISRLLVIITSSFYNWWSRRHCFKVLLVQLILRFASYLRHQRKVILMNNITGELYRIEGIITSIIFEP